MRDQRNGGHGSFSKYQPKGHRSRSSNFSDLHPVTSKTHCHEDIRFAFSGMPCQTFTNNRAPKPRLPTGDHAVSIPLSCALAFCVIAADGRAPENDSIRREDLKADLFYLAGDDFRGRLTATPENSLATEFVASRFARLGFKPVVGDGSIFLPLQPLSITATPGTPGSLEAARTDTLNLFNQGADIYPHRFSA